MSSYVWPDPTGISTHKTPTGHPVTWRTPSASHQTACVVVELQDSQLNGPALYDSKHPNFNPKERIGRRTQPHVPFNYMSEWLACMARIRKNQKQFSAEGIHRTKALIPLSTEIAVMATARQPHYTVHTSPFYIAISGWDKSLGKLLWDYALYFRPDEWDYFILDVIAGELDFHRPASYVA